MVLMHCHNKRTEASGFGIKNQESDFKTSAVQCFDDLLFKLNFFCANFIALDRSIGHILRFQRLFFV